MYPLAMKRGQSLYRLAEWVCQLKCSGGAVSTHGCCALEQTRSMPGRTHKYTHMCQTGRWRCSHSPSTFQWSSFVTRANKRLAAEQLPLRPPDSITDVRRVVVSTREHCGSVEK